MSENQQAYLDGEKPIVNIFDRPAISNRQYRRLLRIAHDLARIVDMAPHQSRGDGFVQFTIAMTGKQWREVERQLEELKRMTG